jgi:alkylation response protein AidB-like acyl-CoA dehydrogenase
MQLRTEAARAGWCRAGVSAADEAASQFAIGYLNLAMRDAVGLGHARMLQGQPGADCGRVIALAEAGALVGVAVTEPSGGTNVSRLNTRAVPDPATGEWHIVGRKVWISRLDEASWWLVYLNSNSSVQVGLVPANAPGLTRIPRRSSGFDEVSWGELCLDAVPLAYDMLLGGDDGLTTFRRHFARWRLLVAAACCGAAASLLDAAFHHLKYRFAQGRQPSDLSLGRLGSCVTRAQWRASTSAWRPVPGIDPATWLPSVTCRGDGRRLSRLTWRSRRPARLDLCLVPDPSPQTRQWVDRVCRWKHSLR